MAFSLGMCLQVHMKNMNMQTSRMIIRRVHLAYPNHRAVDAPCMMRSFHKANCLRGIVCPLHHRECNGGRLRQWKYPLHLRLRLRLLRRLLALASVLRLSLRQSLPPRLPLCLRQRLRMRTRVRAAARRRRGG